ncbi:hypothetical protein CVO74_01210 [Xanthomonas prunicola]|uniref:Uncharacterized protein n=1 Tax=Xanthomonas prunicola TaxID=2053930 RepID=A0A2N3RPM2_9XANT|nr:hypothetical protein XpruCFBP8353_05245 [Xanthomonas prunicola]PKV18735.1 hypothetical protein XpruCFBP8354_05245 [Xanthomonas prunicola]PKV21956.1 hypothetical protein CVO74_01210 [Xanthomonas prunicola]
MLQRHRRRYIRKENSRPFRNGRFFMDLSSQPPLRSVCDDEDHLPTQAQCERDAEAVASQ